MAGLRDPQPPSSGQPGNLNRRRRNSLPALSSSDLNRLSTNAPKAKLQGGGKDRSSPSKSPPENASRRDNKCKSENGKGNSRKTLQPIEKIDSKDTEPQKDMNNNEHVTENGGCQGEKEDILPKSYGSSMLKSKLQSSKTNAVFVFCFGDDDDKSKETSTNSSVETSSSLGSDIESIFSSKSELNRTWPQDSIDDINALNLKNSVRYNTLGFCGFKHKQFRESGKLYLTMSPVQELKTPIDDTEIEMDDEWSMSSGTDNWTDIQSWNGTSSPRFSLRRAENGRHPGPIKINANSNRLLRNDPDSNLSNNLRSALSLSPRRMSSGKSHSTSRSSNQSTKPQSPQRRLTRRGSLDSTVGQIFNNLRSPSVVSSSPTLSSSNPNSKQTRYSPSSTSSLSSSSITKTTTTRTISSSSSSSSSSLKSGDDIVLRSKSQLQPRLLARRRSLSALPDLKGIDSGISRR